MAPIDEITQFLTEKSEYSYGVSLLAQVIPNNRLIHNLMRKESELNWEKLIYELNKYLKNNPQKPRNHGKEKNNEDKTTVRTKSTRVNTRSEPTIYAQQTESRKETELLVIPSTARSHSVANSKSLLLNKVKDKRILLYRSRGHLHGRMHEAPNDEVRGRLAGDIIAIQHEINAINEDLRLIGSGVIPKNAVLDYMTGEQYKEYRNFQNYVVRYKNYLKKENLTTDQIARYQAKLDEYVSKLENYFTHVH